MFKVSFEHEYENIENMNYVFDVDGSFGDSDHDLVPNSSPWLSDFSVCDSSANA